MAVNPKELLDSAKKLKSIATDEADYRSSISRFYYAAYHEAYRFHDKLASPGISKANVGEHENLVNKLFYPTVPNNSPEFIKSKAISNYLKGVLFSRRLADYKIGEEVNKKNLEVVEANISLIFD